MDAYLLGWAVGILLGASFGFFVGLWINRGRENARPWKCDAPACITCKEALK